MTKEEALNNLRMAHDAVKEHPYRSNFSNTYERDYAEKLYDLSGAWGNLIYLSDMPEEERTVLKRFGDWIHNYNASLCGHRINRLLIPYYEAVLQVTHRYLDSGDLSSYWSLEYRDTGKGYRLVVQTRFYLVTKELCGIDSPELPRYFPATERLSENEDAVLSYIQKRFFNKNQAQINSVFEDWKTNLLPVVKWHNQTVAADCSSEAPVYKAI